MGWRNGFIYGMDDAGLRRDHPTFTVNDMMFGGAANYAIDYALRFRASNSAYLSRSVTASNRKAFTISMWVKRGTLTVGGLFNGSSSQIGGLRFNSAANGDANDGGLQVGFNGSVVFHTAALYRDTTAWYHFALAVDTTQATAANRVRLYVNGIEITSFQSAPSYPAQNTDLNWNATDTASIGRMFSGTYQFDGYIAEMHHVDGQQLTPSSFGQTSSLSGQWVPKAYTGTYGTNGFYLKFADASAATAAAIGKDSSGNGNNWTPSGISVTAGITFDQMTDTPTNNYATLNYLTPGTFGSGWGTAALSYANLRATSTGSNYSAYLPTIGLNSGKWYAEATVSTLGSISGIGLISETALASFNGASFGIATPAEGWYRAAATLYNNSTTSGSYTTIAVNNVLGIAVDIPNGKGWTRIVGGSWDGGGDPAAGTTPTFTFTPGSKTWYLALQGYGGSVMDWNAGQRAFSGTAPTGYLAVNTANLSTPSIQNGASQFQATTRTGTGAVASVSSLAFQPDLVWIKRRDSAGTSVLTDSTRGTNSQLFSNQSVAEETQTNALTAFNSNGYSLGNNNSGTYTQNNVNFNTGTYVDWAWKKGTTPGFDIVTYTGNATNRTINHSLGAVPHLMLVKNRTSATGWTVYHRNMDATPQNGNLTLNSTAAYGVDSTSWNNTAPTSSVFSVGTANAVNGNTNSLINYLWTSISGFSLMGSYTGNGSTDGPFVWCGFKPRWLMIKRVDSAVAWTIQDGARNTFNVVDKSLSPNDSAAEDFTASDELDFTANGFKLRATGSSCNASGGTYIFAAFAESPFKYATAR